MTKTHSASGYRIDAIGSQRQAQPKKTIDLFKKLFEPKKTPEHDPPALTLTPNLSDDLTQRIKTAYELVENAKAELSKKTAEFEKTNLEISILAIENQISALQGEIENTEDKLLTGELTTENLLRISAEIREHEKNLADLKTAQNSQHTALDFLHSQLKKAEANFFRFKEAVEVQLVESLVSDFTEKHQAELDNIFLAVAGFYCWPVHNPGVDPYGYPVSRFSQKLGEVIFKWSSFTTTPQQKQSRAFIHNMTEALINKATTGE